MEGGFAMDEAGRLAQKLFEAFVENPFMTVAGLFAGLFATIQAFFGSLF